MQERQERTQFGKSVKDKIHEIKDNIAEIKLKSRLDDITTETLLNNVQKNLNNVRLNADAITSMAEKWANIEKRLQELEKG